MYNQQNHRPLLHRSSRNDLFFSLLSAATVLVLLSIAPQLTAAQSVYSIAQRLKIPDVIPITGSTSTIRVELNGNAVKPGDTIPAKNLRNFDVIKGVSWDPDYDTKYTLMLLDLDRKTNPNVTSLYNQYTNLNIPQSTVGSGQVIVAFDLPSIPCQPSTKHRLVMLAFQQDQTIDLADIAQMAASSGHSQRRELSKFDDFLSRYRLRLAAANIFQVVGEANGICSASTTVYPDIFSISSIIVVMVMFQLVSMRRH